MDAVLKTSMFGKYQLIASLGQGGMASVYLALVAGPAGFNKLLVLKTLREDVVNNIDGGVEMFLDEARLTARMVHPNIVTTYEVGESAGTYFLAMEYLEGQTYRAVCNRGRPDKLAIDDELRILAETARGLHYAHTLDNYDGTPLNVVHRDVSPQNVFITYDGLVKLLDFGIAKTAEAEHMTQVGVVKGKIDYIAPEQLRGDAIDRRADVFALGAMLWEAITGKRFAGGRKVNDVVKAQARLTGSERKVREIQPDVPEALAQIVDRAVALAVVDRFESAAAFADALDAYLATRPVKPSAKTLSSAVMPLFEQERLRIRKTIEEQIQLSKQRGTMMGLSTSGALPAVRAGYMDSVSGVWVPPEGTTEDTEKQPRSLAPLAGDRTVTSNSLSQISAALSQGQGAPKKSRRFVTAVAVTALGAIVGGGMALMTSKPTARSVAPPAPIVVAPVAVAPEPVVAAPIEPAPAAVVVRLNLRVTPESARITLDGAPLTNPFEGEFRPDRTLHHLEISADGYRVLNKLIAFEQDLTLALTLDKAPAAPAPRRGRNEPQARASEPAQQPVVTPPPAKEIIAPRARGPQRTIDSDDPYANN